jgi:hypothetical protein
VEFVILVRGLRVRMITKYPYFYGYVFCVFCVSAGLMYCSYRVSPAFYRQWYWPTQFVTLVAGCGVILEILERALDSYPGAARFLRGLCLVLIATLVCYAAAKLTWGFSGLDAVTFAEIERDLRAVQALFLATILTVVFYYRISLGKNAKGLITGLGIYVGVSLMTMASVAVLGRSFESISGPVQSSSYLLALMVWAVALWSYAPNPVPERGKTELDYPELADQTRQKLEGLRDYFKPTAQP